MLDRIIGILAFAVLVGFMGVLLGFVPDVDLAIVVVVVALLSGYDFYLMLFKNNEKKR